MTGWRFSWRAVGAWLAAALIAGAVFGLTLALCNAWADPTGRDANEFINVALTIAIVAAVGLAAAGGVLLLLVSFVAPLLKAPRTLTEALVLAIACVLATTIGGVSFDLTTPTGSVSADQHPAAFIVSYIAPAATGILMALVYRRLAGPISSRS